MEEMGVYVHNHPPTPTPGPPAAALCLPPPDPKLQRAFPRASVHCSTVFTPLYTTGSDPVLLHPPPPPRYPGDTERWVRAVRWGGVGGEHTPWFVCTDLRQLSPGRAWKARMRCLESLDRVQAASFASGSDGERRDERGCGEGGGGYPVPLRVPTAAASKPGANPKPQPAALPPHQFYAWQRDPPPLLPPHHLQALHETIPAHLGPHPQTFPRP